MAGRALPADHGAFGSGVHDCRSPGSGWFAILTLGCRTNIADSSKLAELLSANGWKLTADSRKADLVIVNSCTVTGGADRDLGKLLRRARRTNPAALLAVVGCLPAAYPGHPLLELADLVVPGCRPEELLRKLEPLRPAAAPLSERPADSFCLERSGAFSRAIVKIQEGCDSHCSYCIVPTARGAPVSLPAELALERIGAAFAAGFEEVVLGGTHLARYGRERGESRGLLRLMEKIERRFDRGRLRLSSLEPDVQLPLIAAQVAASPRWCRHFHVALQHGDGEVLTAMRRHYSADEAGRWLHEVRREMPDAAIGLDFIVGFPTEDEAAFARGSAFLAALPFDYLHLFSFSPRPGTPAATMVGGPSRAAARGRSRELSAWSRERWRNFRQGQSGSQRQALVESRREAGGALVGLTDNYIQVKLDGPDGWHRRLVTVRLGPLAGEIMSAEVVDVPS